MYFGSCKTLFLLHSELVSESLKILFIALFNYSERNQSLSMFPGYLAELGEGKTNRVKANWSPKTQEKVNDRTFPLKFTVLVNTVL